MTISFNRLGNDGRLGNQMFQYAFLRGVAKNREFDWMIPGDDDYSRHNYGLFAVSYTHLTLPTILLV